MGMSKHLNHVFHQGPALVLKRRTQFRVRTIMKVPERVENLYEGPRRARYFNEGPGRATSLPHFYLKGRDLSNHIPKRKDQSRVLTSRKAPALRYCLLKDRDLSHYIPSVALCRTQLEHNSPTHSFGTHNFRLIHAPISCRLTLSGKFLSRLSNCLGCI